MTILRTEVENQGKDLEEYICSFQKLGLKRLNFKQRGHHKYSPTICVDHIKNSQGKTIAHHMWFTYNSSFASLGKLKKGEKMVIKARATKYKKGDWLEKKDYKLTQPTSVRLLNYKSHSPMPKKKEAIIGYIMDNSNRENNGHYSVAYQKWLRTNKQNEQN